MHYLSQQKHFKIIVIFKQLKYTEKNIKELIKYLEWRENAQNDKRG
jgi:hypothetical protein